MEVEQQRSFTVTVGDLEEARTLVDAARCGTPLAMPPSDYVSHLCGVLAFLTANLAEAAAFAVNDFVYNKPMTPDELLDTAMQGARQATFQPVYRDNEPTEQSHRRRSLSLHDDCAQPS